MSKVRGSIILLIFNILKTSGIAPNQVEATRNAIKKHTKLELEEINEDAFYDCEILTEITASLEKLRGPISTRGLLRLAGSKVYPNYVVPLMLKENKIPAELLSENSPLGLLKFEAEGFLFFHQNVAPRKFLEVSQRKIVIDAKSPHSRVFMEGVFEGICNMIIKGKGKVTSTEDYIFTVEW